MSLTWEKKVACRVCDGRLLPRLSLGEIYPSDFIEGTNDLIKVPLELMECDNCGLVQLLHTLNRDAMYRQYWYRSGLNDHMVVSLQDVVENIEERIELRDGDIVLDIGCNDGTLFDQYTNKKLIKIGYDPAKNIVIDAIEKADYIVEDYFSADLWPMHPDKKAKVITSIAMFYDLDDPHSFIEDVREVLHPEGIWVVQMTDLFSMLKINAFDNICHEHLEYYTLQDLVWLFETHGLEIFDVQYNKVNGGSIRVYASHAYANREIHDRVFDAMWDEDNYFNSLSQPIEKFSDRVEGIKDAINSYLRDAIKNGKTVAVMGASTKGNTLLQYFGIDYRTIDHAAEINPDKFGKRTIGTNIPIIPQDESLEQNPDIYLVLPWHFIDNFIHKTMDYLKNGGALLVPMPEPRVYFFEEIVKLT